MKRGTSLGLLIAVLVLVGALAAPTFAASQRDRSTIGDLLVGIASAKNMLATDATTAEAALRAAGYDTLPRLDRGKELTEGDVAAIANAVGLRVASSNPARSFDRVQLDRFLTSMGSEISSSKDRLAAGDDTRITTENSGSDSGKGKKKPHSKSPKKPKKPKKPHPPQANGPCPNPPCGP